MPSRKRQCLRRIAQLSFDRIKSKAFVAHPLAPNVSCERGLAGGPADFSFPPCASSDVFDRVGRVWRGLPDGINKITIALQRAGFKTHIQRGGARRENPG